MKRVFSISICVVVLTFAVSMVYAQMGGGMMGGQGHMEGMLQRHEVEGGLIHHMGQMSRLMQQMRDMFSEKTDPESRRKLSRIMEDMSEHFMKMSAIMKKGEVSQKEMQELDQHHRMMMESYEGMRR